MGVTSKLLALYRVDQQIRGLKSRLLSAERYLKAQQNQVSELDEQIQSLQSQLRQLEATSHNEETESKGLRERIESLRERMNNARTSKEHSAYLTEINTLKADMGLIEERAIESLQQMDEVRTRIATLKEQHDEREKVRAVAASERDQRALEIKDRLAELEVERTEAAADVPPEAISMYESRVELLGDEEVMVPVEEQSRRNMEYTCGGCYTVLPVEPVNVLLKRGEVTSCPSCQAILYVDDSLRNEIQTAQQKKRKNAVPASD